MRKRTHKLTLLTSPKAIGGGIYGDELIAQYMRREFTDRTNPRYESVKWYEETVNIVQQHISPVYKGIAVGVSEIRVYRNLYYRATPRARTKDRKAAVTYGVPRLLFITEEGIASAFYRFEEVAHSLDYQCPFERLRASESLPTEQLVEWWIQHAQAQQLRKGETVPQPLRCHLAIYEAFLSYLRARPVDARSVTSTLQNERVKIQSLKSLSENLRVS